MTTFTSAPDISNISATSGAVFSTALSDSMDYFNYGLYDLITDRGFFVLVNTPTVGFVTDDGDPPEVAGDIVAELLITGSGITLDKGKIKTFSFFDTQIDAEWTISGAGLRTELGISFKKITEINIRVEDIAYNLKGNMLYTDGGITGLATQWSITADDVTIAYTGKYDIVAQTGSINSINLSDSTGNVKIVGAYDVTAFYALLDGSATLDDALNSPDLMAGNDTINALDGNRTWYAHAGNDRMNGGTAGDIFFGGDGNDTLSGMDGDDELTGDDGNDILNGGAGADILDGGAGNDTLDGGTGIDNMTGGDGNDIYYVDDENDVIVENLDEGTDTVRSTATYILSNHIENLVLTGEAAINGTGNGLNNTITGNNADNIIDGGAGVDTMLGGSGNDTYYVDDTMDIVSDTSGKSDTVISSVSYTLGTGIEVLELTGIGDLDGTGNTLKNTITGTSGNNVLDGGKGVDTLIGGDGDDTYYVDKGDVIIEALGEGLDEVFATADYSLGDNIENLTMLGNAKKATGNALDNIITGTDRDNSIDGGLGADDMNGGLGKDTYVVDNVGDIVTEASADPKEIDTVKTWINYTLGANVENLTMLVGGLTGTGNALANVMIGSIGNDTLDGGAGADKMSGDRGDDTYYVDNIGDVVTEKNNGGTDTIHASLDWTLGTGIENLVLENGALSGTGNIANNVLTANDNGNTLSGLAGNDTLNGGDGDDRLDGGIGADAMNGGLGNDTYVVDSLLDTIIDTGGVDTVEALISWTLDAGLENLTLIGKTRINATGNALDNTLIGNGGANQLNGGDGADWLDGGLGGDILTGGLGADTFAFSTTIKGNLDTITDFDEAGGDVLDISALLSGYDPITHALADFVKLEVKNGDTLLSIDQDGLAGGLRYTQIAKISGVTDLVAVSVDDLVTAGTLVVA